MYAAAVRFELLLRGIGSLKEKRRVISSLIADIEKDFRVGIAEVDHQDLWQRAAIGVAVVAPQASQLDRVVLTVLRAIEARQGVEVLEHLVSHLEEPQ